MRLARVDCWLVVRKHRGTGSSNTTAAFSSQEEAGRHACKMQDTQISTAFDFNVVKSKTWAPDTHHMFSALFNTKDRTVRLQLVGGTDVMNADTGEVYFENI